MDKFKAFFKKVIPEMKRTHSIYSMDSDDLPDFEMRIDHSPISWRRQDDFTPTNEELEAFHKRELQKIIDNFAAKVVMYVPRERKRPPPEPMEEEDDDLKFSPEEILFLQGVHVDLNKKREPEMSNTNDESPGNMNHKNTNNKSTNNKSTNNQNPHKNTVNETKNGNLDHRWALESRENKNLTSMKLPKNLPSNSRTNKDGKINNFCGDTGPKNEFHATNLLKNNQGYTSSKADSTNSSHNKYVFTETSNILNKENINLNQQNGMICKDQNKFGIVNEISKAVQRKDAFVVEQNGALSVDENNVTKTTKLFEIKSDSYKIKSDTNGDKSDSNDTKSDYNNVKLNSNDIKSNYNSNKSDYNEIKSDYNEIKSDYNEIKSDYNNIKADYNDIKSDSNNTNSSLNKQTTSPQSKLNLFQNSNTIVKLSPQQQIHVTHLRNSYLFEELIFKYGSRKVDKLVSVVDPKEEEQIMSQFSCWYKPGSTKIRYTFEANYKGEIITSVKPEISIVNPFIKYHRLSGDLIMLIEKDLDKKIIRRLGQHTTGSLEHLPIRNSSMKGLDDDECTFYFTDSREEDFFVAAQMSRYKCWLLNEYPTKNLREKVLLQNTYLRSLREYCKYTRRNIEPVCLINKQFQSIKAKQLGLQSPRKNRWTVCEFPVIV